MANFRLQRRHLAVLGPAAEAVVYMAKEAPWPRNF